MTLRLGDQEGVIAVVLPAPLKKIHDIVAVGLAERKRGSLLQDVKAKLPKRSGNSDRRRFTNQQDVA